MVLIRKDKINNLNNLVCYFNSIIQAVYGIKEFNQLIREVYCPKDYESVLLRETKLTPLERKIKKV